MKNAGIESALEKNLDLVDSSIENKKKLLLHLLI